MNISKSKDLENKMAIMEKTYEKLNLVKEASDAKCREAENRVIVLEYDQAQFQEQITTYFGFASVDVVNLWYSLITVSSRIAVSSL